MHWADVVAEKLLQKKENHVLATAITPSGPIHLGNMREVLTTDAVYRSIKDKGGEAKLIYIGDSYDPLRKVYPFLPESYEKYIGKALAEIPCPCGSHENYAEHFLDPFLKSLGKLGIKPTVYLAHKLYKKGKYNKEIKSSLEKAGEIRKIIEEISGRDLPDNWMPFNPRCEECGRMDAKISHYEYPFIEYKCKCGHEGTADIREGGMGKLPWRIDWPARWKIFGVTFEAFGKDHATVGGSWDTGKAIVKEIFGYPPPEHMIYEFIHLKGRGAMHGSTGTAISIEKILKMMPPEAMRFLLMKQEPSKHVEFDPRFGLQKLMDEYDDYEETFFGKEMELGMKDVGRTYELSQPREIPKKLPVRVPYRHLTVLAQIAGDWNGVKEILKRNNIELGMKDEEKLKERYECVNYWLKKFALESEKFEIQLELPQKIKTKLTNEQKNFLGELEKRLKKIEWDAEEIHSTIHETAKLAGINARDAFRSIYRVILGKDRGPRAGYFLSSLDKRFVMERFEVAAR